MAERRANDSGVESESDESGSMSLGSPHRNPNQLDEGIIDSPPGVDLHLPRVEVKVLEMARPQQMDTEGQELQPVIEPSQPSTSGVQYSLSPDFKKTSSTGKMRAWSALRERRNHNRIYSKKPPRKSGGNDLREAAASNNYALCRCLVEQGADVLSVDSRKRSALHFAATNHNGLEVVKLLLKHGSDPNLQDVAGNTPLHLAICINNQSVIQELLQYGTDVAVQDRSGRNPVQLAESRLRVFLRNTRTNPEETRTMKKEALRLIQLMQDYLEKRGSSSASFLGTFSNRIEASKTPDQFGTDVHDLLASLQHLQL